MLLARDLYRLWSKPDLLERMRRPGGHLRVITPKLQAARGSPFGGDVEWLPLEDCFTWYGGGVAFLGQGADGDAAGAVDPTVPVHGPFSADFRWVWLPGEDGPAIACTPGQAAVFKALWEFGGNPRTAEQIMQRAGLASQKPIDVFKGGKYTEAARVYRGLVVTQQRQGLYAMPCAQASSLHCK